MLKKSCLITFLIFFITLKLFAQNEDLKFYSDYSKGFKGYATSIFIDDLKDDEDDIEPQFYFDFFIEQIEEKLPSSKKITKQNTWLINQAMNEWDYAKDEIYCFFCADSEYATKFLMVFLIVKGKENFTWKAFEVTTDFDFDDLFSDF